MRPRPREEWRPWPADTARLAPAPSAQSDDWPALRTTLLAVFRKHPEAWEEVRHALKPDEGAPQ